MNESLEQLYQEARSALKAKDYDRASDLLKQVLVVDENYKDASRLLARGCVRRDDYGITTSAYGGR
jgi:outer membrane protein assembly factor BamD (BamD/ComL family)